MTAVRVQVTQQDIDHGRPDDAYGCPVARAVMRATGRNLPVSLQHIGPAETPLAVSRFVADFDSQEPAEPFEFDLDVPDDLLAGAS